ncbi:MAG: methyltransferase domain-containing protein [Bryobacteraceae bacterium]|nr:methyltransferase domain-containing protein [Bryobacteraceae bacterium]
MRIAFFSPMPPSRSGIADYSAALLEPLSGLAQVRVFSSRAEEFQAKDFDVALYQIGNNGYHEFVYQHALECPGVVVMHEANLHHLIAEITIRHGEWDAYLRELEFDGGPAALSYGLRARALEVGPDYEGVPMMRRLLQSSTGVIAHSRCVQSDVRKSGFAGPSAVIPHGAWIPDADALGFRQRLGIGPETPLIGIFGFLKPYKRIAESLRAFRRLLRVQPQAKMILVGEPHPEFPLASLISSLGISTSARILGFTPIEEFVGYIAACDVVLNLRWPTVGESSGTLLRSLGLGRAVVVSDVGSFQEYPDDICLKVPVGPEEEDILFEYLNLLVTRPALREQLGQRAKAWVERECDWYSVAKRYVTFLESILETPSSVPTGAEEVAIAAEATLSVAPEPGAPGMISLPPVQASEPLPVAAIEPEYVLGWAESAESREYIRNHLTRLQKTLQVTPPGGPGKRVLEMGAYLQITPALKDKLQYTEVRGCYFGPAGHTEHKKVASESGEVFSCDVDLFDAEKDLFPYAAEHFDTVLCCELLEHLPTDPMHMMCEVNRILKTGGHLVVTTPNICSFRAVSAILQGYHPGFFPAYLRPAQGGGNDDARHAREYAPRELVALFRGSGFEVTLLETGEFQDAPHPEHVWVQHLLENYKLERSLRGDGLYVVGVKQGPVRERYPRWLYS